jgi:hypothetical protein
MSNTTMGASYAVVSVEYWEAQVDSWLAQLAEIRNLLTLPDWHDRSSVERRVPRIAPDGGKP